VERDGVLEVESVAHRAGSSVGLVYRHFGSRAGLIGSVVDDFYQRYRAEALETNPAPRATFSVRERQRIETTVNFHYHDPLDRVISQNLHLDAEVAVMEGRHRREMTALAGTVVELGQRRGEVPVDRDPALVAALVIGGPREALGAAVSSNPPPPQRALASRIWLLVAAMIGVPA